MSSTVTFSSAGLKFEFPAHDPRALLGGSQSFYLEEVEVFLIDSFVADVPVASTLLNNTHLQQLYSWTNATNITLCYKSSLHGTNAHQKHERCASKQMPMLYVFNTNSGRTNGGFISRPSIYHADAYNGIDARSFLFSFTNYKNQALIFANGNPLNSYSEYYDYMAIFGSM